MIYVTFNKTIVLNYDNIDVRVLRILKKLCVHELFRRPDGGGALRATNSTAPPQTAAEARD